MVSQDDLVMVWRHSTNPGGLGSLGIRLLQGRDLERSDTAETPLVALVSRSVAERFWPGRSAVGQRLMSRAANGRLTPLQVVGVAADARHRGRFRFRTGSWADQPQLDIYLPIAQRPNAQVVPGVRASGDAPELTRSIRAALSEIDPTLPLYDILPLSERMRREEGAVRFAALLMNVYGALAIILAAIGVYGVLAYSVTARAREFGIRRSLGAQPARLVSGVVAEGLCITLVGALVGLGVIGALTPWMSALLFDVAPTDSRTLAVAALVLVTAAAAASYLPARRAVRSESLRALTDGGA